MRAIPSSLSVTAVCLAAAGALAACTVPPPPPPADAPRADAAGLARVAALPAPYKAGDPVAGREAFGLCAVCHTLDPAKPQLKGPPLNGVFGARAAARTDYADYSEALRSSGLTWDAPHLDQWIFNPHETLPGTSMTFIGIRADKKRRDLIAYLAAVAAP